jgi:hypothetical protein
MRLSRHHAASLSAAAALLFLLACGRSASQPTAPSALPPAPAHQIQPAPDADWFSLALLARNMNLAQPNPRYPQVGVRPQAETDFAAAGKGLSGLRGLNALLAAPSRAAGRTAPLPAQRHSSQFTADDLILSGEAFDPLLPQANATAVASATKVSLASSTDPSDPQVSGAAFATYRFTLENYATSGQPQSVGTLWDQDDMPSTYYIGLSDWQGDRWAWFEGSADNVVTVASLAPYIKPLGDEMLVAVVVLDNQPRDLLLVQVGAKEYRALGGAAPLSAEGQEITGPEDYYDGKSASAVNGAPAGFLLDENWLGPVYNQGELPACTCCAAAGMFNYELSKTYAPYWDPSRRKERISPKWNFKETGLGQCWAGRPPETILDFLKNTGGAPYGVVPWNGNCVVDYNAAAAADQASHLKVGSWRKIGDSVDEIKHQLFNMRHPVLLLMTITDELSDADPWPPEQVYHWSGTLPDLRNWHSMLIFGYDDARQAFRVRNSWGDGWGDDGNLWIGYDNFAAGPWIDCYVMSLSYHKATATYFNITQDAAVPPEQVFCSIDKTDRIDVQWDEVPLATGYNIYRDKQTNLIGTVQGGATTTYSDTSVTDTLSHTYYIQTVVQASKSAHLNSNRGWKKAPVPIPVTIGDVYMVSYQHQGQTAAFVPHLENPDGSALTYSWSFPAGSIVEASPLPGRGAVVTLDTPGAYEGTLTVTNDAGPVSKNFPFEVFVQPPTASFSVPGEVNRNKVTYFDASASSALSGHSVTGYAWDFDHDNNADFLTTNPQFAHIFTKAGAADLGLLVVDDRGIQSDWYYANFTVVVPWAPPVNPDPAGGVGTYTSLAVVGGLPAIAYNDEINGRVMYVRATAGDGAAWSTPVAADPSTGRGYSTSLCVVNGVPALSYQDSSAGRLMYVHALDATGASWATPVSADPAANGLFNSLCVIDGRPAISYCDGVNLILKYVRAADAAGDTWSSPLTVDGATPVGYQTSMAVVNGRPAISYWDLSGGDMRYVRASDADGTAWGAPVSADDAGSQLVGYYSSLGIVDGKPAISYLGSPSTGPELRFVRALDVDGATWASPQILDDTLTTGSFGQTTLRIADGLPVIAYYNGSDDGILKFITATDATGQFWNAPRPLDGGGGADRGQFASLAILPSGAPAISYLENHTSNDQDRLRFITAH